MPGPFLFHINVITSLVSDFMAVGAGGRAGLKNNYICGVMIPFGSPVKSKAMNHRSCDKTIVVAGMNDILRVF